MNVNALSWKPGGHQEQSNSDLDYSKCVKTTEETEKLRWLKTTGLGL